MTALYRASQDTSLSKVEAMGPSHCLAISVGHWPWGPRGGEITFGAAAPCNWEWYSCKLGVLRVHPGSEDETTGVKDRWTPSFSHKCQAPATHPSQSSSRRKQISVAATEPDLTVTVLWGGEADHQQSGKHGRKLL